MTASVFLFVAVFRYRSVAAHSTGKHRCSTHQEERGQDVYLYTQLYLCGESEYSKCKMFLPQGFSNHCHLFSSK